jgi:hypothetical protein
MTIQRQYSLPNCTLIIEGLGDTFSFSSTELRPLLAILINAECRLMGREKPISGGREFLDSLIQAVSQYAQGILSGLNTARTTAQGTGLVQLQRMNENIHRLSVRSQPVEGSLATPPPTEVDLSTVELFDLVEAIDQLLADTQTLPDLTLSLKPASRREVVREKRPSKQVVPAAIGLSSLAAAAMALSLLPVPKVQEPKDLYPPRTPATATNKTGLTSSTASPSPSPTASPSASASPNSTASPSPTASPNLEVLANNLTSTPAITDAAQLETLSQNLRDRLDKDWKTRTEVSQDLVYQVGVAADGTVKGYKPINPAALDNAEKVPLLDWVARQGDRPATEPLALFKVLFTPSGNIEVAPWQQAMTSPVGNLTEITENAQLEAILPKLKSQINRSWDGEAGVNEELIFKVRTKQDGSIVDYSPENEAAAREAQDTPLAKLGKPIVDGNTAPTQEPLALFKVVFRAPDGAVEVSPWRGWQSN